MLSDDRTDAGIVYTLTFNLGNGHTFIPLDKLTTAVIRLLSDEDVVFDEDRSSPVSCASQTRASSSARRSQAATRSICAICTTRRLISHIC